MKRAIPFFLAFILCLVPCFAEEGAADGRQAVLRFSSFAGGGYEYTVEASDPSVVRCETKYEYEEHAEEIDGASFDFVVSFTGLKPGSTTVAVYGRSPILENEDHLYTVTVDESLVITLAPVRVLSFLFVYRSGEIYYDSYRVTLEKGGYRVSVSDGPERPFSAAAAEALMQVIDTWNVVSWDGFSESRRYVLDGEGFWLDLALTDGTRVSARGDNAFPAHYHDAIGDIWDILTGRTEE